VPGALVAGDELHQLAVAADQKVGGYLQVADLFEVRVFDGSRRFWKKASPGAAELFRRQADVVDHHQRDVFRSGGR
jgi:hypothetical protein